MSELKKKEMSKLVPYVGTFKQLLLLNYCENSCNEHLCLNFVFFLSLDSQQWNNRIKGSDLLKLWLNAF